MLHAVRKQDKLKKKLGNTRVYQSTFHPEVTTSVNSKFTCCSQALKFGTDLSKKFRSLWLYKSGSWPA